MATAQFDVANLKDVQGAVRGFYDQRVLADHQEWTEWLRPQQTPPERVKSAMAQQWNRELLAARCGCGLPFPEVLRGANVLDIGCGSGADCMVLSHLVGNEGKVVGLDLCPTLIADARKYAENSSSSNVVFVCDDAENISTNQEVVAHGPYDVIVANCSFCLIRNCARDEVAQQVYSLLKPGGEFYISDLFVSVDVSECARRSPGAWVEGFAGAWMWNQFRTAMENAEFTRPILVSSRKLEITDERRRQLAAAMGVTGAIVGELKKLEEASGLQICAATYRVFRPGPRTQCLEELVQSPQGAARITYQPDPDCEDPHIQLSRRALCRKNQPMIVPKDIAISVLSSRLASKFTVVSATSVTRLMPDSGEPFFPKPLKPGKIASSPDAMPLGGLTFLNGSCANGQCTSVSQPSGVTLATILDSDPALKELRDTVKNSSNGGCGPGGC